MQRVFTPQEFLSYLNQYLKVKSPDIIEEKSREERAGKDVPLFPLDTLAFDKDVDLIICGPCSDIDTLDRKICNEDFPMGKCMVNKGEPDRSWLHSVLSRQEKPVKNVVVYATCCGYYTEGYKRLIKKAFPEISWHFPYVRDLCDNHHPDWIAEGLLKAGFLKIVQEPVVHS